MRYGLALLVALAVALAAAAPAATQQPSHKPGAGKAGRSLVGLPLFSSDGQRIGRIVASGTADNNETVLVAEIERSLGIGANAVAIPFAMLVRKQGRVELTITAAEVEERIAKAGRDR
jgi:PRC-barrel domain protein